MKNLRLGFDVVDSFTLEDFMWILLTSGVFLMALSLPRFLVHAKSSKELKEKRDQFFEDGVEILSSFIIILISYAFLFKYLDYMSMSAIAAFGLIALVLVCLGYSLWLKPLEGRVPTKRETWTFQVAIGIALLLLLFDILLTLGIIVI